MWILWWENEKKYKELIAVAHGHWFDYNPFTYDKFTKSLAEHFIKENELHLQEKQIYSYIKHPLLDGKYKPSNFELTDMEVHFSIYGQLLQIIKTLPNGTSIGDVSFSFK